jgi:hypothetical protein
VKRTVNNPELIEGKKFGSDIKAKTDAKKKLKYFELI